VGTDTLISGTSGVGVKTWVAVMVSVGDKVIVGEEVGDSGVNVSVGSGIVGDNISSRAARVSPAITVSAAVVLIALVSSGKVMPGIAHARTTIDNVIIVKESRLEYVMVPPIRCPPGSISIAGVCSDDW